MRLSAFLPAVLISGLMLSAEGRTWTNSEGKTLEADLVRVKGDSVYLELAKDGTIHSLDIGRFSHADQEYVRQFVKDQLEQEQADALANRRAKWLDDYDDVMTEAKELSLPILLLYTAPEWCGYCVKLDSRILGKNAFQEYANSNLVLFMADFSNSGDADDWKEDYPELIKNFPCTGYPCAYLMTLDGKQLGRISGYDSDWSVQDYIDKLEKYRAGER